MKPHQITVMPVAADINKYTRTPEKNPNSTPDTDRLFGWLLGFPGFRLLGMSVSWFFGVVTAAGEG